jgi:hypothetical protein
MYANLKTDDLISSVASAVNPLQHTTKHRDLLSTDLRSGTDLTFRGRHVTLTSTQFISKME